MLFSTLPMAEERYFLYGDSRDLKVDPADARSVDGKTIGVMENAIPEDVLNAWEADNGIATSHTQITTAEDVLENLEAGSMDCFVSVEEVWDQDYVMPLLYIGSSDVYFAVNQGRADIKKELDGAMARIASTDPYYNDALYEKYFAAPATALWHLCSTFFFSGG